MSTPWTLAVAQLKTRVAETHDGPDALRSALDDILGTCEALLTELGETELELARLKLAEAEQEGAYEQLFHEQPVACLVLTMAGRILHANEPAAALLNVSARRLPERLLVHFIEERESFQRRLDALSPDDSISATCGVRPRERARVEAAIHMVSIERDRTAAVLCFLVPQTGDESRARSRPAVVAAPAASLGAGGA